MPKQTKRGVPDVSILRLIVLATLVGASGAGAEQTLTREMIRELMQRTDVASTQRDAAAIGEALASDFYKYVDVPSDGMPATARIDKRQYLRMIESGWQKTDNYHYRRRDVVINLSPKGDSGESFSTIVETFEIDGKKMVSKVREYASYRLEAGRPVIVTIDNQTLVGDTTPGQ